jgi:hypothetical protein
MALKNNQGWIATYFVIFLVLITTLISVGFSFQLQLNQEMKNDQTCRHELNSILNTTRDHIHTVFELNPLAETLYQMQMALKPFIWNPKIAALYAKILAARRNMDLIQKTLIKGLDLDLTFKSFQTYLALKKDLENSKKSYEHFHQYHYMILPVSSFKMAIKKSRADLFPPYQIENAFEKKQELKIPITIYSNSKSKQFVNQSYSETKNCHGSLQANPQKTMKLVYYNKSNHPNSTW